MSWRARLSTNMLQLRFSFCPESEGSLGTRDFIWNNYKELKRLNPRMPFLVRPSSNLRSKVTATYDYGGVAERDLEGLTESQITEKLQELNLIGQHAIKATHFPWQSSVPNDIASMEYEDIPIEYR